VPRQIEDFNNTFPDGLSPENLFDGTGILKQSADIGRGATIPTLRMLKFNMSGSDPLVDNEMELTVRNYGSTPAILDALYISFDDGDRWPTAEGTPVAYGDQGGGGRDRKV
jgi:hypothetical protein